MCRLPTCQKKRLRLALKKIVPLFNKHRWGVELEKVAGTRYTLVSHPFRKITNDMELNIYGEEHYYTFRIKFDDVNQPHQITRLRLDRGIERYNFTLNDFCTFLRNLAKNK